MMLWAHASGALELRRQSDGGARLRGTFPYGKEAVLSDGGRHGRPRKEVIESRAFAYRVELPDEEIHLLVGHDFDHPLASKLTGTLSLRDTPSALLFDAVIPRAVAETTHARDALALIGAGLAVGISPGFRVPPERAVKNAETFEDGPDDPENGEHRAIIRRVHQALLYELSIVTRPMYAEAQVEARRWSPERVQRTGGFYRWR
jgi:uncharacterized protein